MRPQRVLIVSFYYSPKENVATLRVRSFAEYIARMGISVDVITHTESKQLDGQVIEIEGVRINYIYSKSLITDLTVRSGTTFLQHKLFAIRNKFFFNFYTDTDRDFTRRATTAACKIVDERDIDLVFTSFGPLSPILVGLALKNMYPKIRWIADIRDEIANSPLAPKFIRRNLIKAESRVLGSADLITGVSKPVLDGLWQSFRYPEKLFEVRNGYSGECDRNSEEKRDTFTITYAGSFYGERYPGPFLEALKNYLAKNKTIKIEVRFYGVKSLSDISGELRKVVKICDRVPHCEIRRIYKESSALLLIHPTNGQKGVFTGKIFEYLSVNRPIIGLVDINDVAAGLITEANAGYICPMEDVKGIENLLSRIISDWTQGILPIRNWQVVEEHHRDKQWGRLLGRIEKW